MPIKGRIDMLATGVRTPVGVKIFGPNLDTLQMLGERVEATDVETAVAGCDLTENDSRQDYLRAKLSRGNDGRLIATPFAKQDSSMQFLLQQADCLVIRPPCAPALAAGSPVPILRLEDI
jgi:molybdopterin molybdotransferase